ncbi:MAG: patatin-like phospholipase family protein [Candidatus Gastranaerophilales bacterium]|nr:patatin-like phospholipase family protein [Candidatus Gastranaerophilales bacterium]
MEDLLKNEYFAIFGGGGIRGLTYCGAYKALLENNIKLTGCAGSSIGAVFASLLSIGYNHEEIYEIMSNTGFEMFTDINLDIKKDLAISKGKKFLDWMREHIERKFYGDKYKKDEMPRVKFSDLKSKLVIYSVDLTNSKFKEFSKFKTPDFEIASAVRASVSMPGLFTPLELDNNLIVDGDLLKSTPLWRVTNTIKDLEERIIEFRLEDNESPKKISNSIEYLNRVYNAICGFATDYIIDLYKEKDKFDYIKINTQDVSVVDFLISKEKKQELCDLGYEKTNSYFKNFYPEKRKMLLVKYEKLFHYLNKLQKEFNKSNTINTYLRLCEMFVFLCEEKKYIDTNLYNKIINFKNKFMKNYKTYNFFYTKKAFIKDKENLSKDLLDIIKIATIKTQELNN